MPRTRSGSASAPASEPGTEPSHRRVLRVRAEPVVFVAALLLQLVPLGLLRHLGTQDGPSHLATARVLLEHGSAAHPIYAHFYWLDAFPSPNLATEGLLTALVAVFPPEVAEKLIAAGYLLALPLALRYVLARVDPASVWLSYAAFPLANGFLFVSGFSNYCYGVVVFVLAAGWILRPRRRAGLRYVLTLAAWLLLAYVTHFIPAALLVLTALVPPLADAARRSSGRLPTLRSAASALGPTLLAMVPLVALSLLFVFRPAPGEHRRDNPLALLVQLPVLVKPIVALSYAEYPVSIVVGLGLIGLIVLTARRRGRSALKGPSGHVATVAGLCSLLYLVAPESTAQGGAINARLAMFPPLLALLWLGLEAGRARLPRALRAGGAVLFLVAAVVIALVRWPIGVRHSHQVDEYVAAAAFVRPGSTVLGLQYESANVPTVRGFSDPTLHGASLVAVLRYGVDLGHYEAELTYFPTRFRSDRNLHRQIDPTLRGLDRTPSRITTLTDAQGRGLVDYVLVRGDLDRVPPSGQAAARQIAEQLGAYREIGVFGARTGPGTAPLRLYERR
ncbi:MAG TPA: glycosyltransferase family 87 protein [Frankiaceae bacterium]|nr:glycosyltransferase family 87 protein [Frankiaceae bacterium]